MKVPYAKLKIFFYRADNRGINSGEHHCPAHFYLNIVKLRAFCRQCFSITFNECVN